VKERSSREAGPNGLARRVGRHLPSAGQLAAEKMVDHRGRRKRAPMSDAAQAAEPAPIEPGPESPAAKRVLAIFAHPDDPEFTFAGTAARWASEGHEITYCIVTDGSGG